VLEPNESVTANRNSPLHWTPHICAQQITVDPNHGVWKRRNRKATKRSPHHRRRRNVATRELGVWRPQRVSDENRGSGTKSSAEKKVETRAVGGGGAHGTITTRGDVTFLVIPFENEMTMAGWQREGGKRTIRREDALERRGRWQAAESRGHDKRGEPFHFGSTRVIKSP
jgi:hypothetical protein